MRLIDADKLKGEGYKLCRINGAGELDVISLDIIPTAFDPTDVIEVAETFPGIGGAFVTRKLKALKEDAE